MLLYGGALRSRWLAAFARLRLSAFLSARRLLAGARLYAVEPQRAQLFTTKLKFGRDLKYDGSQRADKKSTF